MSNKIAKVTQSEIEKLEKKISELEKALESAKVDLAIKREILKIAQNGQTEGRR